MNRFEVVGDSILLAVSVLIIVQGVVFQNDFSIGGGVVLTAWNALGLSYSLRGYEMRKRV